MLLWNAPFSLIRIWFAFLACCYISVVQLLYAFYIYEHFVNHLYELLQVILGEEVAASKLTLFDLTKQICDAVQARAEQGFELYCFSFMLLLTISIVANLMYLDQTRTMGSSCCQKGSQKAFLKYMLY